MIQIRDVIGVLTRDVNTKECGWLPYDLKLGDKVKKFFGCTYGCISHEGIAVNINDTEVFYEIPFDSVEWL